MTYFEEFKAIVLDSSILFLPLDDSFFDILNAFEQIDGALFCCPAFNVERDELLKAIKGDTALVDVAKKNIEKLGCLNVTQSTVDDIGGYDCESLVCYLAEELEGYDIAVATTNKLFIERLILNDIPISIIDLCEKQIKIIRPSNFNKYKSESDVLSFVDKKPSPLPYVEVDVGDLLICGDGTSVVLSGVYHRGGREATIYSRAV